MKPMKPMLAFDPSMAHEVVAGEPQREYLGRLLAPIPTNGTWVMEPKLDGIRWQVLIDQQHERVGPDWKDVRSIGGRNLKEHQTPMHLANALAPLPAGTILDGELVAGDCSSDVGSLSQRGKQHFVVFDVLAFDGHDTTRHPWDERHELLVGIAREYGFAGVAGVDDGAVVVPVVAEVSLDVLCAWVEAGCEGAVCKRRDAPYSSGGRPRSGFVKIKPKQTTDAIVVGWEMGEGKSNRDRVGALKVRLVETGIETKVGYDATVEKAQSKLDRRCEVQHFGHLASGKVRHPGFVRWREDLE
jgi:ATP-dependent DNA ligase